MILVADVGNTRMEIGFCEGDSFVASEHLSTRTDKTTTEYALDISYILDISGIDRKEIEGAIMASVVPPLNHQFAEAIKKVTGHKPLLVGPGIKTGLRIKGGDPAEVGADLVAAAVGGVDLHGAPLILIDMGTATTYTYIDEEGAFAGVSIVPGVSTSADSLVSNASLLPKIDFVPPKHVIMSNTIGSMQSGIIFGEAARIDGLVRMIRAERGENAKVVATGGLAGVIIPYCDTKITLDNNLIMHGLKLIYERNR